MISEKDRKEEFDSLFIQSELLARLTTRLQLFGVLIFIFSFAAATACVAAFAYASGQGLWDGSLSSGQYGAFSNSDSAQTIIFTLMAIVSASSSLFLTIIRDGMVRRGQVLSDVLIEVSERTDAPRRFQDDVSVKVAIRTFSHIKALPLSGAKSTGGLYVGLSIVSLLCGVYLSFVAAAAKWY